MDGVCAACYNKLWAWGREHKGWPGASPKPPVEVLLWPGLDVLSPVIVDEWLATLPSKG